MYKIVSLKIHILIAKLYKTFRKQINLPPFFLNKLLYVGIEFVFC